MAETVKVFVSHSKEDNEFTAKLVQDLQTAGADVWVDFNSISSNDFVQAIDEGLRELQWFVLVMTPDALKSAWVKSEVNAALNLWHGERIRGVVPIVAKPCKEEEIPPLLALQQRYDATSDYSQAIKGLRSALGLSLSSSNEVPPFSNEETKRFDSMMSSLSLESVQMIETDDFQRFCAYVFTVAGYSVRTPIASSDTKYDLSFGADRVGEGYILFNPNVDKKVTGFEVRRAREANSSLSNMPLYIITRSTFEQRAYSEVAAAPNIHLFDSAHLLRYVSYITSLRDTSMVRQNYGSKLPISPDILFVADGVARRSPRQTKVVALAHNKGGVGSTTIAFNLALELAQRGQTTLLVDMDDQGSLSDLMLSRQDSDTRQYNLADYFHGLCSLRDLVIPTVNERIWLIPADKKLLLLEESSSPDIELQFTTELHDEGLRPLERYGNAQFDWIILDTSPALTLYVRSAMVAAHYVLALTSGAMHGDIALKNVLATLRLTTGLIGLQPRKSGCLITQMRDTAALYNFEPSLTGILQPYGMHILETRIPFDENVRRFAHQSSIRDRGPRLTKVSRVYGLLVDELLERFVTG